MPQRSRRGQDPKADDFLFLLERSAKRILRASNDRRSKEAKRSLQIAQGIRQTDSPDRRREEKEGLLHVAGKRRRSTAKGNTLVHSPIRTSSRASKIAAQETNTNSSFRLQQSERWANPRTALAGLSLTSKPPRLPQLMNQPKPPGDRADDMTSNNNNNNDDNDTPKNNIQRIKMTQQLRSLEQVYSATASEQIKPQRSLRPVRFKLAGDPGGTGKSSATFENDTSVDLDTMLRRAARIVAPGSLPPRPEHTAPRRLSVALWTDAGRQVPMERGLGDLTLQLAKLNENELQGPTNWTHVDLRVKYRDEASRMAAYRATQNLVDATAAPGGNDDTLIPVLVAQHPCHTDFYALVRHENSQFTRQVNARNRLRHFAIDMEILWRVNRPGSEAMDLNMIVNEATSTAISELSYPPPPSTQTLSEATQTHARGGPRGLSNRRDSDAHEQSQVQVQSVSTKCALAKALYTDDSSSQSGNETTSETSSEERVRTPEEERRIESQKFLGPVWCTVSAPIYDRGELSRASVDLDYDSDETRIAVVSVHSPTLTRPDAFVLRAYDTASSTHCTVSREQMVETLLQYARSLSDSILLRSAMHKTNTDHPDRLASAHLVRTAHELQHGIHINEPACSHTLCKPPARDESEFDTIDDTSKPLVARFVVRVKHPDSLSREILCCRVFVDLEKDRLVYHVGRWRHSGTAKICVHVPLQIAHEHGVLLSDPVMWGSDDIELLEGARHIALQQSWIHAVFAALALSEGGVTVPWPTSRLGLISLWHVPLRIVRRFLQESLALPEDQGGLGLQETARKYRFMTKSPLKTNTAMLLQLDNDKWEAHDDDVENQDVVGSSALVIDKEREQLRILRATSAAATTPTTLTFERAYLEGAISAKGIGDPSSIVWGRGVPGWSLFGQRANVLSCFIRGIRSDMSRPIIQTLSQSLDNPLLGPIVLAFTSDTSVGKAEPFENSTDFVPTTIGPYFHIQIITQVEVEVSRFIMALNSCTTFEDVGGMKPELYSGHRRHDEQVDVRGYRSVVMVDTNLLTQPNPVIESAAFGVTISAAVPGVPDTWPFRYTWHSEDAVTAVLVRARVAKDYAGVNYRLATIGSNDPMLYGQRMSGYVAKSMFTKSRSRFDVEEKLREELREREALVRRARAKVEIYRQSQEKAMKEREFLRFEQGEKNRQDRLRVGRAARLNKTLGARTEDWLERVEDVKTKLAGKWGMWQAYWFIDEESQELLERHRDDAEKLQLALVAMGEDMKSAEELVAEEQKFYIREATLMYHNKEENIFSWDQPRGWQGIAGVIAEEVMKPDWIDKRLKTGESKVSHGDADYENEPRGSVSRQKELAERDKAMKDAQSEDERRKARITLVEAALANADMVEHARMVRTIEIDVAGWLDSHASESEFDKETGQASTAFDLRMFFRDIDEANSALVNNEEFKLVLAQMGFNFSEQSLDALLREHDPKGLGLVDYYEIVNWLINIPCLSSDSWFALSTDCKQMPPSAWEKMRYANKMIDSVVEWQIFRDMEGTREVYYFNTSTGEYCWRQPERVAVLLRLRRDAVELAQAQSAASLAAEAAVQCLDHAERAADRSVDRLVSALSGSQAFVELLASQLGLTLGSCAQVNEEEEALALALAQDGQFEYGSQVGSEDGESEWTDNDLSSSGEDEDVEVKDHNYADDDPQISDGLDVENLENEDGVYVMDGERKADDEYVTSQLEADVDFDVDAHENCGPTAVNDSVDIAWDGEPRSKSAPTTTEGIDVGQDLMDRNTESVKRQSTSQPIMSRSGSKSGSGKTRQRRSQRSSLSQRRSSRLSKDDNNNDADLDDGESIARRRKFKVNPNARGAIPHVRDLAATLHKEIARMKRHTMMEQEAVENGGTGLSSMDAHMDADVALEKPGVAWRLLRATAVQKGFVTKASEPQTMGLKHGLMTGNKPSLVGVVDACEVSHFSFADFPVVQVFLLDNLNKELAKMAKGGDIDTIKDAIFGKGPTNEIHDALELVHECFLAVKNARMDVIEKCFDEGMQVSEIDEYGNTVLHIAAQQGLKRISKFLLRKGADINAQNLSGNSVLHYCFEYKLNELAEYFIAKGADDTLLNAQGLTCYEGLNKDNVDSI